MTTIEFYNALIINDDNEIWNEIDNRLFGSDYDLDIDNAIFNWEN